MFSIIAAIDKNNGLGKNGKLLFNIKEDMQFFKATTTNHTVVMGYNTWKSLPGKLKNRKNLVVSHSEVEGADGTITDLPSFIKKYQNSKDEIFIIGGGMIYSTFLPYAKALYLTEIEATAPADTFFPKFNKSDYEKTIIKEGTENDLNFSIIKYTKK
ncbi:dihydrofolate reductase [Candidatus Saccharibacteria bacterium]|nr:dihydrofolate reductase [Candidatus Saccharibacteria bacterium]